MRKSEPKGAQEQQKVPEEADGRHPEAHKRERKKQDILRVRAKSKDQNEGIRATRAGSIDRLELIISIAVLIVFLGDRKRVPLRLIQL